MMPFDAPEWPVKRTKQTNPTLDGNITNRLLYPLSYLGPMRKPTELRDARLRAPCSPAPGHRTCAMIAINILKFFHEDYACAMRQQSPVWKRHTWVPPGWTSSRSAHLFP
jgi:hypothetical protein